MYYEDILVKTIPVDVFPFPLLSVVFDQSVYIDKVNITNRRENQYLALKEVRLFSFSEGEIASSNPMLTYVDVTIDTPLFGMVSAVTLQTKY